MPLKTREERIHSLQQLIESDPKDPFPRYALAMEYVGVHDIERAINILEVLIATDHTYVAAYHQLGLLYHSIHNSAGAQAVYKKGIQIATSINEIHEANEMTEELNALENEL